ncbi:hypothetical protein D9757_008371 [Collybiopsis confluens]|uniref:GATA-type domain-containing protein n=1 Tax=Collybiopsis confluens TaxID=2823264 RepID=A0A8H5HEL6_9AGAR|nr:hypothetical protein D9757_008371 [Collybiopsis confluens]
MEEDVAGGNYDPFWVGFPLTDIHRCVSPDILHQLYLGVLKYLILWIQTVVGEEELDRRVQVLPASYGVRHFGQGISTLSQASGTEYKHIARILLACLIGKMSAKGLTAVRSLLHFVYLAQYPSHDQYTLGYMKEELDTWHQHRSYFIENGAREDFNIPKFHSLLHYIDSIRWLGTTDNCNTESFERLHIDFAKEGWRASNKRNHFPQMVQWLSRQEKVASFDFYQSWVESGFESGKSESQTSDHRSTNDACNAENSKGTRHANCLEAEDSLIFHHVSSVARPSSLHLATLPQEPNKKLSHIVASHLAPTFISELKLFLHSLLPAHQQTNKTSALQSTLPFTGLDIWHQYKSMPVKLLEESERETLKAVPLTRQNPTPRFDTVIVLDSDEAESTAVEGCRAARLKRIGQKTRWLTLRGSAVSNRLLIKQQGCIDLNPPSTHTVNLRAQSLLCPIYVKVVCLFQALLSGEKSGLLKIWSNANISVPPVSGNSTYFLHLKSASAAFKVGRGTAATTNNLNNVPSGRKAECSNCGATRTPIWRRGLDDDNAASNNIYDYSTGNMSDKHMDLEYPPPNTRSELMGALGGESGNGNASPGSQHGFFDNGNTSAPATSSGGGNIGSSFYSNILSSSLALTIPTIFRSTPRTPSRARLPFVAGFCIRASEYCGLTQLVCWQLWTVFSFTLAAKLDCRLDPCLLFRPSRANSPSVMFSTISPSLMLMRARQVTVLEVHSNYGECPALQVTLTASSFLDNGVDSPNLGLLHQERK